MLVNQALHHAHQWDVTLGHRLEEPVFFEEMLMFRMTNEWKMRVKNERKRTGHRRTFNVSFRAKRGTSYESVDHSKQNARRIMRCDRFGNRNWQSTIARSLVVYATRDGKLQRAAKVLEAVQALFDYVDTGGVTEPDSAIVTESSSRNDCNVGFTQEAIGEILRGQTKLTDIHQHVKRALRFDCGHIGNL